MSVINQTLFSRNSAYETLQDQYYENIYGAEGNARYVPEDSRWYSQTKESFGQPAKDSTSLQQHQITDSAIATGQGQQNLLSNNAVVSDASYSNLTNKQENQWDPLNPSLAQLCDTSNPTSLHFMRTVKNSLAASQYLQRYVTR